MFDCVFTFLVIFVCFCALFGVGWFMFWEMSNEQEVVPYDLRVEDYMRVIQTTSEELDPVFGDQGFPCKSPIQFIELLKVSREPAYVTISVDVGGAGITRAYHGRLGDRLLVLEQRYSRQKPWIVKNITSTGVVFLNRHDHAKFFITVSFLLFIVMIFFCLLGEANSPGDY